MKKLTTYLTASAAAVASMATMALLSASASAADATKIGFKVGSGNEVKYDTFKEAFEVDEIKNASDLTIKIYADVTPSKTDWAWNSDANVTLQSDGTKKLDISAVALKTAGSLTLDGISLKGNGKTTISAAGDVTYKTATLEGIKSIKGSKGHTFTAGSAAATISTSVEGFDSFVLSGSNEVTLAGNSDTKKSALKVSELEFQNGGKIKVKDAAVAVDDIVNTTGDSTITMDTGYTSGIITLKNDVTITAGKITLSGANTDTPAVFTAKKATNMAKITVGDNKVLSGTKGLYSVMAQAFTVNDGSADIGKVAQWSDVLALVTDSTKEYKITLMANTPKAKISMPKANTYKSLTIVGAGDGKDTLNIVGGLSLTGPTTFEALKIKSYKKETETEESEFAISSKSSLTVSKGTVLSKVKSLTADTLTLNDAANTITAGKIQVNTLVTEANDHNINANTIAVKTATNIASGKKIVFKFADAKTYEEITEAAALQKCKVTFPKFLTSKSLQYGDDTTYEFAMSGKNMVLAEKNKAAKLYNADAASGDNYVLFVNMKDMPKYLETASTDTDNWTLQLASGTADYDTSYDSKGLYLPTDKAKYASFKITAGEKKVNVDLSKCKLTNTKGIRFDEDKVNIIAVPASTAMQKLITNKDGTKTFKRMTAVFEA